MTRRWSIRWKLTAWYIAALSAILVVFGGVMTAMMIQQFHIRLDGELREEGHELAEKLQGLSSIEEILATFDRHYAEHGGFSFQISREDGTVLCGTPWLRAHSLDKQTPRSGTTFETLSDVSLGRLGIHRVFRLSIAGPDESLVIHVLTPYAQFYRELQKFIEILVFAGGISIGAACFGGLMIARRALTPLKRIIATAEQISAKNLNLSIEVENPNDELGRLTITLNAMFDRLRESVERIQRFTADAAHELRTPLTVLRTRLEVAMRMPVDTDEYQDSYRVAIEQAERLAKVVDQLLMLSRQDAGVSKAGFDEVYLKPLIEDVAEMLQTSAQDKQISLELEEIPNCVVWGDDISLSRVFFNLIDNAIKYTPSNGHVTVSGQTCDSVIRITVSDTGMGIAAEHLPKLFDRFYRVDPARTSQSGGTGLGLAICRAVVQCHNGNIFVASTLGKGTSFTVELPLKTAQVTVRKLTTEGHAPMGYSQISRT